MNEHVYEKYVQQIQKEGSITKAAKSLSISQPALSMGLSQLEKALGFSIFNRKTMPLTPTDAGQCYLQYLNRKNTLETECRREIDDILRNTSERVSIGAANVYIRSILIDTAAALHGQDPACQIRIESASVPELTEQVKSGSLDCMISTAEATDESLISLPIRKEKTCLCVPAQSALQKKIEESGSDPDLHLLDEEPMIRLKKTQPLQITVDRILTDLSITPHYSFVVDQVSTALSLTAKGMGSCFATSEFFRAYDNLPGIASYTLSALPERIVYVVYPKNRYVSNACRKLINLLSKTEENDYENKK